MLTKAPQPRLLALSNYLRAREFATPSSSGSVEVSTPNIGILILPDGKQPGMLEDLFLAALQGDLLSKCIDQYFECVDTATTNSMKPLSKARIHAWLSAQDPPDMRLGFAAQKGLFDWDDPAFAPLKDFLTLL